MISCPACQSCDCRRSRRRGFLDFAYEVAGLIPWRCNKCESRFHARPVPLSHAKYAHCSICGNFELKRIAPEHVPGFMGIVGRVLGLPSLRCDPCRHKFFSVRPLRDAGSQASAESEQKVA